MPRGRSDSGCDFCSMPLMAASVNRRGSSMPRCLFTSSSSCAGSDVKDSAGSARSAEPAESFTSEPAQDDDEVKRQRGIEEPRRLTEAAINGIEQKSQPESERPLGIDRYEMPADPEEGYAFGVLGASASLPEWKQPEASPMPNPGALAPPTGQFPLTPAPHQATFDDTVRTASTEIPVWPMNQPQPTQGDTPSQWGSHPLDAVQAPTTTDVNNFQPVRDAPRPDLSRLNNWPPTGQSPATDAQSPTTDSQVPTTGALFNVDPSATGQIGSLRRTPDLPPVGGAQHFKWHHLAVIGALVFVLGVVTVSYTHLRAHETDSYLVCRLL